MPVNMRTHGHGQGYTDINFLENVAPVDPLVESKGAELGFKTVWLDSWNASLALWYLELDSDDHDVDYF